MLPISILVMNCRSRSRNASEASTNCSPACAVKVLVVSSIAMTRFIPFMSMIVPSVATQGVKEWQLPIARTGLGNRAWLRNTS